MILLLLLLLNWTTSATAYCTSGITASGRYVQFGYVAQNGLPFGTRVRLYPPAFGRSVFRVQDRIGAGSNLDIYINSCYQAIQFGRRTERVTVLGK